MKYPSLKLILPCICLFSCLNSCRQEPKPNMDSTVFTLSDTSYAKLSFDTASTENAKNTIRFFGNIQADNNKSAQVFPVLAGIVKSINVNLGDYVKQGQVLASIQSSEVASMQKERMDALNDQAIAQKQLQVAQDMFKGKLTSEQDLMAAKVELKKANAEVQRTKEVMSVYGLGKTSLYNVVAPISGYVITKKINPNEQISDNNDSPIFSIADINEVWAFANVNECDISQIKEGYTAVVKTLAFPDSPYTGKIDKIINTIDPDTKAMKMIIKLQNKDNRLKPDMNCSVSISYNENIKKISVPSQDIIFDKNKYWVVVYHDRHNLEIRQVDIYRQLDDVCFINSGLNPGEIILGNGRLLIYDALNQ